MQTSSVSGTGSDANCLVNRAPLSDFRRSETTLLRHTARQVCRAHRGRRRAVPILLYLRDHVAAIVSMPDVALPELLRGMLGPYRADEPAGWFEQRLRDGDCVVLLDGLDEVARQEDRGGVADWVERQIRQYPKNDYVITSRPQGYRTTSIDGATVLQVRSFTDEQVTRFVRGWYLAVERHSTGTAGEDVGLRAASDADDLLTRLNDAPGLYDLTVNPLLLTMIATVHRYRGALPGSRADLYGEICQVMLWRRQEAKKLPIELDGDKKEALLRGLAFTMMQQRVRDLPRADLLAEIRPGLRRMSRNLTAEGFLTDIGSNGLLIERESGLYAFAHQTFQEYLAASYCISGTRGSPAFCRTPSATSGGGRPPCCTPPGRTPIRSCEHAWTPPTPPRSCLPSTALNRAVNSHRNCVTASTSFSTPRSHPAPTPNAVASWPVSWSLATCVT